MRAKWVALWLAVVAASGLLLPAPPSQAQSLVTCTGFVPAMTISPGISSLPSSGFFFKDIFDPAGEIECEGRFPGSLETETRSGLINQAGGAYGTPLPETCDLGSGNLEFLTDVPYTDSSNLSFGSRYLRESGGGTLLPGDSNGGEFGSPQNPISSGTFTFTPDQDCATETVTSGRLDFEIVVTNGETGAGSHTPGYCFGDFPQFGGYPCTIYAHAGGTHQVTVWIQQTGGMPAPVWVNASKYLGGPTVSCEGLMTCLQSATVTATAGDWLCNGGSLDPGAQGYWACLIQ